MIRRQACRMRLLTNNNQRGIALGPILFIIAILAILAAAIAAGSGGFNASTSTESAKAMAEVVINSCHAYKDALDVMLHNGCDANHLDYTPNGGGYPTGAGTWTHGDFSTGGTGHTGNGQCAFFDPRGGNMIFKPLPPPALSPNLTGDYTVQMGSLASQADAYAGYPWFNSECIEGQGTCYPAFSIANSIGALTLSYFYLNKATCVQINTILQNNLSITTSYANIFQPYGLFVGDNLPSNGTGSDGGIWNAITPSVASLFIEGCGRSGYSNMDNNSYEYFCALYIQ
jgi:hypothetical protein